MPLKQLQTDRGGIIEHVPIPLELITGTGADPRPRLRVDVGQTSFFENRERRMYHEFNIAPGASVWLRWTCTKDIDVHGRDAIIVQGQLRYALYLGGGTVGGTWIAKTLYRTNNYSDAPVYVSGTAIDVGGTYSGGTEIDLMLANAGTGGNSSTASVGVTEGSLAAGTYFVELRSVGAQACIGMYRVNFEERAVGSPIILTT